MNPILQDMRDERQRRYDDAKNDLIKAMISISKLDQEQRNQLVFEIISLEVAVELYTAMNQFYG